MNEKILIVDDDENICELLRLYLSKEGYQPVIVNDGLSAVESVSTVKPALILLDVMLPKLDGWQVCRKIRQNSDVPIIMLSAKGETFDKILGLELGADDYIVKPFSLAILYSKLLALLERTAQEVQKHKILSSGQISLDPERFEVKVADEVVDMPPKEYQILKYMMEHPGVAITRRLLLAVAWGGDDFISERVIDNRVKNLRKILKKEGSRIKTLIGVGYRFD